MFQLSLINKANEGSSSSRIQSHNSESHVRKEVLSGTIMSIVWFPIVCNFAVNKLQSVGIFLYSMTSFACWASSDQLVNYLVHNVENDSLLYEFPMENRRMLSKFLLFRKGSLIAWKCQIITIKILKHFSISIEDLVQLFPIIIVVYIKITD